MHGTGAIVAPMTTLRRSTTAALLWLAFGLAVVGTFPAASAFAASDESPTRILRSFTFESHVRIEAGDPSTHFGIDTTGVFVAPSSQDCRARVDVGGFRVSERAVVAGRHVYLDDGDGFDAVGPSAFTFRELCPSDPAFWEGLPDFADLLDGVSDTRDGVKVERYDVAAALQGFFDGALPDGVEVQEFTVYIARHRNWPVAIEARVTATTDEACSAIGGDGSAGVALTAPCSVSRTIELHRPDDPRLAVRIPASAALD
jgi:hypothetical protein